MSPDFETVVDALIADGCLQPASGLVDGVWLRGPNPSLDVARLRRTTILLAGAGAAVEALEPVLIAGEYRGVRRIPPHDMADAMTPDAVVVAAFDWPAKDELLALDELCRVAGRPWVPLRFQDGRAFLGPAAGLGATARFRDLLLRRRAAERDVRVHDVSWLAESTDQPPVTGAEWAWIASTAAVRIERWIAGAFRADIVNAELELDPVENTVQRHHVLMLPDRVPAPVTTEADPSRLVDPRTGVISRLRDVSADECLPPSLHLAVADVADMRRILDWPNDRRAFGSSWDSADAARAAATGEAVERYCGNWTPPYQTVVTTSFDRLRELDEPAVDPDTLTLYSDAQYGSAGFPFSPFRRSSQADWVKGWSLTQAHEVWVPAFLVYVAWRERGDRELRFGYPNLTGIAAGPSLEYATLSGLEEVIERDTSMTWWAHARSLPPLKPPKDVKRMLDPVGDRFEARLTALPNEFTVPVVAGVVRDRVTGWSAIGTAVRDTFAAAARKALAEAFSLQQTCRSLDQPATFSRIVRANIQSSGNLKHWRADRRYLDAYRDDFHDVVDLMCQLQVHLDSRAGQHIAGWVWNDLRPVDEPTPPLPERSLDVLRQRVEQKGHDVVRVEVTTPDVAEAGLHVVRTVVPGLVANFPAAFPMWGRQRIEYAGAAWGWPSVPGGEAGLNIFPMPHA